MKPNKHIMKKTNLKYEAKHEIQTHNKTIEQELVVLSRENYLVGNVWQILQQESKFFFQSFGNIWERGVALRARAPLDAR